MSASKRGNELGCKSTYQQYLEQQQLPSVAGFHVAGIRKIELAPWQSMGGLGAYLHLEGSAEVCDAYVCEIPPRQIVKAPEALIRSALLRRQRPWRNECLAQRAKQADS
jgi:hypothetical protein